MQDAEKLAQEDPFRYQRFQLAQTKAQAAQQELAVAQQRQQTELATQWKEFSKKDDSLFAERAPEMADPAKARALLGGAVDVARAACPTESGIDAVREYLQTKSVWIDTSGKAPNPFVSR